MKSKYELGTLIEYTTPTTGEVKHDVIEGILHLSVGGVYYVTKTGGIVQENLVPEGNIRRAFTPIPGSKKKQAARTTPKTAHTTTSGHLTN